MTNYFFVAASLDNPKIKHISELFMMFPVSMPDDSTLIEWIGWIRHSID